MAEIAPHLKARGERAERAFRDWLDKSYMPYTYLHQERDSFPRSLEGKIKRPDFLVGIIGLGTLAFDVKSKPENKHGFIISEREALNMGNFQRFFNMTVLYAFMPPEYMEQSCAFVANDAFLQQPSKIIRGEACRIVTPEANDWYNLEDIEFLDAIKGQVSLR